MQHAEALLIGGRAGVGKSTIGWEVSAQLCDAEIAHAIIEGDFMGQVHPAPEHDPDRTGVTEHNLAAVWSNYAQLGCRRLIYTRTVCVLPEHTGMFERAMGAEVRIIRVLLTASDETASARLTGREMGSRLEREQRTSALKAPMLEARAPAGTIRVATDGRSVIDIAREVAALTGWRGEP
ncbi:hypothetical protein [Glycomyces buryatensis]|uniref:UDP-N-acetylglucosamine kinase n=1 Tax=Glycomyces buryatensis TaxID=2570927 RepID=A0A4S8QB25_9ACTN|nr:hypothetical protein [Glycomyces buryatensis]THV41470.1 hypothetical protein FAB82_11785 [Glycomyces buryatensis]